MTIQSGCKQCGANRELVNDLCSDCRAAFAETLAPKTSNGAGADTAMPESRESGERFGDYELLEEVARGGMGVIYRARHLKLNRIAALKMILSGRFSSELDLQRFHVEASVAATLDHPGIVPVYEIGEVDGQAFFAMKYIDGGSLADAIPRFQNRPKAAVELLAKVVRAVHHAHQRGILHRDLKPANILIDEDGSPLIADLGLAKSTATESNLTNPGAIVGTPSYMPPEQASGNSVVTTAADIYSVGAIMYELLTGVPPFRGKTAMETVMQVLAGPPEPPHKKLPDVDRDLELICMKCLKSDPDDRYSSAMSLLQDLEAWLSGDTISVKHPSLWDQTRRWFQKNHQLVYLAFALIMGVLISLPFALNVASGNKFGGVYNRFPDEQRPWLYSVGRQIPVWVGGFSGLLTVFVFWPLLGLVNARLTRPETIWRAIRAGAVTSALLASILFATLGWIPLLRITWPEDRIKVLTEAMWQPKGSDAAANAQAANQLYAGLEDVPIEERAKVVTERLASDQLANAPEALGTMCLVGLVACTPVVFGTMFGFWLQDRGNWWITTLVRYLISWIGALVAFVFLAGFVFRGAIITDGGPLSRVWSLSGAAIAVTFVWLVLRRWKSPSQPTVIDRMASGGT